MPSLNKFPRKRLSQLELESLADELIATFKVRTQDKEGLLGKAFSKFISHIRWLENEVLQLTQLNLINEKKAIERPRIKSEAVTNQLRIEPRVYYSEEERIYEAFEDEDSLQRFMKWSWAGRTREQLVDIANEWAIKNQKPLVK